FLLSVFRLRLLRLPCSTLFPTRRSSDLHRRRVANNWRSLRAVCPHSGHWSPGRSFIEYPHLRQRRRPRERSAKSAQRMTAALRRDRKSTRLNSSHVKISYAVFCLKKKTQ